MVRHEKCYALYKGEDLMAMGTVREIAEQIGVKRNTVYYYRSKVYAERTSEARGRRLVCLED